MKKVIAVLLSVLMIFSVFGIASFADDTCEHVAAEPVEENVLVPTCTESGWHDEVVYCEKCGEVLSVTHYSDILTGHTDEDGDSICDECGMTLSSATTGKEDACDLCGLTGHTGDKDTGLGFITARGGLICWFYRIVTFVLGGAEFGEKLSVFKWFPAAADLT